MASPRIQRFLCGTQGAILAGASAPIDITKLRSRGLKQSGGGRSLKVARLVVRCVLEQDTVAASLDGIVPGRRWMEAFQRVTLSPQGWPVNYSHDCSGAALRRQAVYEYGGLMYPDGTDIPDADATDLQQVLYFEIAYWRPTAARPEDFCPPAVAVGEGDLVFAMQDIPVDVATGLAGGRLVSARVMAECFMGDDEIPVFTRLQERGVAQNRIAFDLNVSPDRLRRAYLRVNGPQTGANGHLPGSFDETVTVRCDVGDTRILEDCRIDEQVQTLNRGLWDQAAAESLTVPEVVPLFSAARVGEKTTKQPLAARDGRVEFSADPADAASGTATGINLITDETYGAKRGSPVVGEFLAVTRKRPEEHELHKVTDSKVQNVAPEKADATPWRIKRTK